MESLMKCINRTHRCFTLYRGDQLAGEGINGYQHIYILRVCENPGIAQDKLAGLLYVNKSSVTRQLTLLEQNGFVTRKASESDRRQLLVYPTERARALYPRVREVRERWRDRLLEGFTQEEQETLTAMMERVMRRAMDLVEDEREGSRAAARAETREDRL